MVHEHRRAAAARWLSGILESGGFEKHIWRRSEAVPDGYARQPAQAVRMRIRVRGYDGHEVQQLAANIGINILPGAVFSPSGQYKNCIRLNCGHPIEILEPAIKALAALL